MSKILLREAIAPIAFLVCLVFTAGMLIGMDLVADTNKKASNRVREPEEAATALPSIQIRSQADVSVLVDGACDVNIESPAEVSLTMGWATHVTVSEVCEPEEIER